MKGVECEKDLDVHDFVLPYAQTLAELGKKHNKKILGWVQLFKIAKSTEDDVRIAIETFREAGVKNIAGWGYRGAGHMSYLASEDPNKVWKVMGETYGKIKRKK